jgi:hypothetical protein
MSIPESEKFLNKITLDCLINKKYTINKKSISSNKKDKKFYKRRIYDLTKELLDKDEQVNLFPDVKNAFDNYINSVIHYFKTIDNNDIIQSEYKNIFLDCDQSDNNINLKENGESEENGEVNKILIKKIEINNSLDSFVQKNFFLPSEQIIIPKQKDINLQDPTLKIKGVKQSSKKKNINNKYEENNEEKEN